MTQRHGKNERERERDGGNSKQLYNKKEGCFKREMKDGRRGERGREGRGRGSGRRRRKGVRGRLTETQKTALLEPIK